MLILNRQPVLSVANAKVHDRATLPFVRSFLSNSVIELSVQHCFACTFVRQLHKFTSNNQKHAGQVYD